MHEYSFLRYLVVFSGMCDGVGLCKLSLSPRRNQGGYLFLSSPYSVSTLQFSLLGVYLVHQPMFGHLSDIVMLLFFTTICFDFFLVTVLFLFCVLFFLHFLVLFCCCCCCCCCCFSYNSIIIYS